MKRQLDMTEPKGVVDLLFPEHGRTSCSDENLANGFESNGHHEPPRCARCALLELLNDPGLMRDHNQVFVGYFERRPWIRTDPCPHCGQDTDGPTFCGKCGGRL